MAFSYCVPSSALKQLRQLTQDPQIHSVLEDALKKPLHGNHKGACLYKLELKQEIRESLLKNIRGAMNENGYDGCEITPCGHIYEGLESILKN